MKVEYIPPTVSLMFVLFHCSLMVLGVCCIINGEPILQAMGVFMMIKADRVLNRNPGPMLRIS